MLSMLITYLGLERIRAKVERENSKISSERN